MINITMNGKHLLKKLRLSIVQGSFTAVLLLALALNAVNGMAATIKIIDKPVPNMVESRFIALQPYASLDEDLGNDLILFYPRSFTADKDGNIYTYDSLQAKVFKFDKELKLITVFGAKGRGPGEFSGTGKTRPVKLNIGPDGNLYANDIMARKVLVFSPQGRFIRSLVYGLNRTVKKPVLDNQGHLYLYTVNDHELIQLKTLDNSRILNIGTIEDTFQYLYYKPGLWEDTPRHKYFLYATVLEMLAMDRTGDGKILLYYPTDSTLIIIDNGKIIKRVKLWPRDALAFHKHHLPEVLKVDKAASKNMFYNLFIDSDTPNLFYLQMGRDDIKKKNLLYQFDTNGTLKNVFYVPYKSRDPFTLFRLKVNGRFLAFRDEKIELYTE